jgi:hypothetical protein
MNEKSSVSTKQPAYSLKDEIYSECTRSESDKLEFNLFSGALEKYLTYSPHQPYCVSNYSQYYLELHFNISRKKSKKELRT